MLGSLGNTYQLPIWKEISGYAAKYSISITAFPFWLGHFVHSESGFINYNFIEPFLNGNTFDGIIFFFGVLATLCKHSVMQDIIAKMQDSPSVSLNLEVEDAISVTIENYSGMYKNISHLITCHGYKNIAFIKGPEGHYESEERFSAF